MQATARAHPNIALIKYWGKRDPERNLPAVGSISITLDTLHTDMTVTVDERLEQDELRVNGEPQQALLARVAACLDDVAGVDRGSARISSRSNFPIAAGLASSASAFAALAVAANAAFATRLPHERLVNLAGRASGSAARSLAGGFVELENTPDAVHIQPLLQTADWPLRVVVAITAPGPKPMSSGAAMELSRKTSPFYDRWVTQQASDLDAARAAIAQRDFAALGEIAEHNCLKMHSVMWASRPPMIYWNSATLACMQTVRELRADGVDVFFTIDAGPQLKAVCLPADESQVLQALRATPGVSRLLQTGLGNAARLVDD